MSVAETILSASILEAIPDAVAAINQPGFIIQVNAQTETLLGYTRDEMIGQSVEMPAPDRQRIINTARIFTRSQRFAAWVLGWISARGDGTARNFWSRSVSVP